MPQSYSDHFRSGFSHLELKDLLQKPPSALLGVSAAAELALDAIGIKTVFDLGSSWLFANARAAAEAAQPGASSARLGFFPTDWLNANGSSPSIEDLGTLDLKNLRGLTDAQSMQLKTALDVSTIRDFACWPPQLVAGELTRQASGSTFDGLSVQTDAEELRPRFGEYPTERVYYNTLVMLSFGQDGQHTPLNGPVSLKPAVNNPIGFNKPAVGAYLTLSQSWFAQGITLGHMLHSLALAPGEATRVAVIDWSRKTGAATSETVSEAEQLDNSTFHTRALSEVQSAVADEMQQGGSSSQSSSASSSSSGAIAAGTGLVPSLWADVDVSGTTQSAQTAAQASSSSWSIGNRSVSGRMAQDVNDRTQQHSTSVRNRRASAIREVSQSEHEQVSTRVVANYNHMHALTVQYYEVVQVYRTLTELQRAERCLFIPMELISFAEEDAMDTVERFRGALIAGALTRRAASLLADTTTSVALRPVQPVKLPGLVRAGIFSQYAGVSNLLRNPQPPHGEAVQPFMAALPQTELAMRIAAAPDAGTTPAVGAVKMWNNSDIAQAAKMVSRPIVRPDSDALYFPDEAEIVSLQFEGLNVKEARLDRVGQDTPDNTFTVPTNSARVDVPPGIRLIDVEGIHLAKADDQARSGSVTIQLAYLGRRFLAPSIPVELSAGIEMQKVVSFESDQADRRTELLAHLRANHAHYSQAIFRALDAPTITMLLSQFEWNGRPLVDQVEPRPLSVVGNYLVMNAPAEPGDLSGVSEDGVNLTWSELLSRRQIEPGNQSDQRMIPIPTEGVFAEAVLGRANAAEKLDITRFWNWQDSPIPLTPTEIAPVSTGSRAEAENLMPSQLGQPVLNIVNPTSLPEPAGLGASLSALANGNMFRDMSGLAGTQGLVQAGMQGTLEAATDAGQIASANMRTEAQKSVAMAQVAADIVKAALGAPGGGGAKQSISEQGAHIEHGKDMDRRGVPGPQGNGGGSGASPGAGGGHSPATAGSNGQAPGAGGGGGSNNSTVGESSPFSHESAATNKFVQGYSPETTGAMTDIIEQAQGLLGSDAAPATPRKQIDRPADLSKAATLIASFKAKTTAGKWPHLNRATVADRLTVLIGDHDQIDQASNGLCGPALFFNMWIGVDPLGFATFATDLFDTGQGLIGSSLIRPDSDLRDQDYTQIVWTAGIGPCPQADWMVMSAVRDDGNIFLDYEGTPAETWAQSTTISETATWLKNTGAFSRVDLEQYRVTDVSYSRLAQLNPSPQRLIGLSIKTSLIKPSSNGRHQIALRSNFTKDTSGNVSFTYWSWQQVNTITVPQADLENKITGIAIADL